jgi:hypothetical protein
LEGEGKPMNRDEIRQQMNALDQERIALDAKLRQALHKIVDDIPSEEIDAFLQHASQFFDETEC